MGVERGLSYLENLYRQTYGGPITQTTINAPTTGQQGLTDITGLMNLLTQQYQTGLAQRQQQYQTGMGALEQALTVAQAPAYDEYAQAMLERARTKAVSGGVSRLISSGMLGTTRAMEPERAFAAEVETPFMKGLAEARAGRIAAALGNIAQYQAQFPQMYPEAGTLAYLATGGFGALTPQQRIGMEEFPTLARMAMAETGGGGGDYYSGGSPFTGTSTGGGTIGGFGAPVSTGPTAGTAPLPGASLSETGAIQMAGGYGPAFQSPTELAQAAGGGPTATGGGRTIWIRHYSQRGQGVTAGKQITVPASALGSGPGGFKDESAYKTYVPPGYEVIG